MKFWYILLKMLFILPVSYWNSLITIALVNSLFMQLYIDFARYLDFTFSTLFAYLFVCILI